MGNLFFTRRMSSQFSFGIARANKENSHLDQNEPIMDVYRNNKENIPPNDIAQGKRVFGQEICNLPRKPTQAAQPQKPYQMRRSLTMDQKGQNVIGIKDPKNVLGEKTKTNNFISENENFNIAASDIVAVKLQPFEPSSQMNLGRMQDEDSEFDAFDIKHKKNPQVVPHVAKEIFNYLKGIECDYLPKSGYMENQNDINEKMRAILIDWLVDVNVKFKLVPECLYMTWNIIDRFLTVRQVTRHKLQLVGVSALLIACKYEEIYPPPLKEFVAICDKAYTAVQILEMEADVLLTLDFKMTHTSALRFLDRYCLIGEVEAKAQMFAKYLIETSLLEYHM